jgi:hypothetical protein
MKTYIKIIDNKKVIKKGNEIIINKNGMNTFNPTEEMILLDGWNKYNDQAVNKKQTKKELLNSAKERMIESILKYDSSENVNVFYIGSNRMWFDKLTRVSLKLRFDSELKKGKTKTKIWNNGVSFEFGVIEAIYMLNEIEVYASSCYDNTQQHIENVKKLDNIDDVNSYDYKTGYPIIVRF